MRLLEVDPDLAEHLEPAEAASLRDRLVVPVADFPRGRADPTSIVDHAGAGLLVLHGVLVHRAIVSDRVGAELLGEGDALRPLARPPFPPAIAATERWEALTPLRLAILDGGFLRAAAQHPTVVAAVFTRAAHRADTIAYHRAVRAIRDVADRLLYALWHLSDRWGHVVPEGRLLELPLRHDLLGELIGASRATVTSALGDLVRRRAVATVPDGFLLYERPGTPIARPEGARA